MSDTPLTRPQSGRIVDASRSPRAAMPAERELPNSTDAEKAVLGAMILDAEQIENVMGILKPVCFHTPRHERIYEAIVSLHEKGQAVDFTTLIAELARRGQLEEVGGPGYIMSLEQYVFSTINAPDHGRIVLQKYQLRELIQISESIRDEALFERREVDELLDHAEKMIFELNERRTVRDFQDLTALTMQTMEEIERRCSSSHEVSGVPTGYTELDEWTGGFQASDLIILAARPSVGKTALALNLVCNIGMGLRNRQIKPEIQRPVGIFSLEMGSNQIWMRMMSTVAEIPMQLMRSGKLNGGQRNKLMQSARNVHGAPIYVDDTPGISVMELRAKARRLKQKEPNLSLIIIDYLQLMRGNGQKSGENRQQEVSEISRSLKALARELEVPIIALSQLSRLIEQRKGKHARPMLSDLRESGAIEQDADMVMFLHREKHFDKKDGEEEEARAADVVAEPAELIIGKQRNGPIGTIDLLFFKQLATYHTLAKGHNDDGPSF